MSWKTYKRFAGLQEWFHWSEEHCCQQDSGAQQLPPLHPSLGWSGLERPRWTPGIFWLLIFVFSLLWYCSHLVQHDCHLINVRILPCYKNSPLVTYTWVAIYTPATSRKVLISFCSRPTFALNLLPGICARFQLLLLLQPLRLQQ